MTIRKERSHRLRSWVDRRLKEPIQKVGSGRHAPRMYKMVPLLAAAFLFGTILVYVLFVGLARLKGLHINWWAPQFGSLRDADLFDLTRDSATFAALFGGIFAIVYAYRKQRVEEAAGHRADAEALAKRYQDAAVQLGHDKAAVRLAGVYAMSRLADDWPEQRQTCINVLCAYLRMPWDPQDAGEASMGDGQVRRSIVRLIDGHLSNRVQVASWSSHLIDLRGAKIVDLELRSPVLNGSVDLSGATLIGTNRISSMEIRGSLDLSNCRIDGDLMISQVVIASGLLKLADIEIPPSSRLNVSLRFIAPSKGPRVTLVRLVVRGKLSLTVRRSADPQGAVNIRGLMVAPRGRAALRGGRAPSSPMDEGKANLAFPTIYAKSWWVDSTAVLKLDQEVLSRDQIGFTSYQPRAFRVVQPGATEIGDRGDEAEETESDEDDL